MFLFSKIVANSHVHLENMGTSAEQNVDVKMVDIVTLSLVFVVVNLDGLDQYAQVIVLSDFGVMIAKKHVIVLTEPHAIT